MKLIRLIGKHAVGVHEFTQVDDDDYPRLNAHRWKAKPNGSGNNVYAIRAEKGADGITRATYGCIASCSVTKAMRTSTT